MQCVRFVGWHHVSSVYKWAVTVCVCLCVRAERERKSSRVGSLSHVAFLPVFRLLSGSGVVPSKIKQTPKTPSHIQPPQNTQREGVSGREGGKE